MELVRNWTFIEDRTHTTTFIKMAGMGQFRVRVGIIQMRRVSNVRFPLPLSVNSSFAIAIFVIDELGDQPKELGTTEVFIVVDKILGSNQEGPFEAKNITIDVKCISSAEITVPLIVWLCLIINLIDV